MRNILKKQIKVIYGTNENYSKVSGCTTVNVPRKLTRLDKRYKAIESELKELGIVLSFNISKQLTNELKKKHNLK